MYNGREPRRLTVAVVRQCRPYGFTLSRPGGRPNSRRLTSARAPPGLVAPFATCRLLARPAPRVTSSLPGDILLLVTSPLPADIARRVRDGSLTALEQLYRATRDDLFALAYRLMLDEAMAADVVHDVYVGLPEAFDRYEERGQLQAWLRRVTARVALQRLRSESRRAARDGQYAAARGGSTPSDEGGVSVEDALARLPVGVRAVVVLRELHGLTHGEIARTLGITAAASRIRLWRGLERLRHLLGEETQ